MARKRAAGEQVLSRQAAEPEVFPALQQRSRDRLKALLASGFELLEHKDFEAISISDITSRNGFSVGSFYNRFRDKEAFLAALQEQGVELSRRRMLVQLNPERVGRLPVDRAIAAIVSHVVETFRQGRGLIRASLKHDTTRPGTWSPMKQSGAAAVEHVVALLTPMLERDDPRRAELDVRIAMQNLYGLLVNAVLNDPGPLHLDSPLLEKELTEIFRRYLKVE